ncbi:MAG: hypothetical protein K5669_02815 [Lachnospiraceae bacterium]|nr:hypothetical protein [Lachnospiraceae bacterium]
MKFMRLFSADKYKGEKNYINNQRTYEILRTILLFALSAAVYLIGYLTTHSNKNLLTIVAVLGCLPAAKSAVNMIMFLRFKSCNKVVADEIETNISGLVNAFDRVFTSYEKNYPIAHCAVKSGSIICFTEKDGFPEEDFYKHLNTYLKAENHKDLTIKVFTDKQKYIERLNAMKELSSNGNEEAIMNVILSITL